MDARREIKIMMLRDLLSQNVIDQELFNMAVHEIMQGETELKAA